MRLPFSGWHFYLWERLLRQSLEEARMSSRGVVWTLAILAVVLVVVPLLGMAGMMTCCAGMMNMGGNMMGMSAVGIIWMLLAAAAVIALIVIAVRGATRT